MARELLSVEAALAIVRDQARSLPASRVDLLDARGLALAEAVRADADSPPFTKSAMDGYALRAADLNDGQGEVEVIEEIAAGVVPTRQIGPGQASRIMTGAMIPDGADAVVPFEQTQGNGSRVRITLPGLKPGANVLPRGQEMRAGEEILPAGRVLRPQDLGLLATVGQGQPLVVPPASVHILSTGDEVVGWNETPGPGQIRNSNGVMLHAQVQRAGGRPRFPGIVRDDADAMRATITEGLLGDVLILSGGVSAGKRDLVPEILDELGVRALFHKVALKPGKPLLFGTLARTGQPPRLVFGLPGNPVSSFVCFELFVRPALAILAGRNATNLLRKATLAEGLTMRSDRPTYHPALLEATGQGEVVRRVPWFGSSDLRGVGAANALMVIPAGDQTMTAGTSVEVLALDA